MQKLHGFSGALMVLLFLASGAYLRVILPPFDGTLDSERMMYRASHLYLFMVGSMNLLLGFYWQVCRDVVGRKCQAWGSSLILLAQPLFLLAFMLEPGQSVIRPWTVGGAFVLLGGVVMTVIARVLERRLSPGQS
ncbi:hypothetical protein ACFVYJ_02930 [Pontibacter sp. JAM-7]|uniref:hypothetical protein n=1 Tax=Pontibacter sp. JAM-7 TaxID=3366581 RepID=UPI003AF82E40